MRLVGGSIFFHKETSAPSFFGGIVLGYRIQEDGKGMGCAFEFRYFEDHRGISAGSGRWNNGMKIVPPAG